jgi:hypothetical protein
LLNGSFIFLGLIFTLTFIFLLPPITFAPTDCPSHRSLIPIQRSKNKNLKIKISGITNPFSSVFIYKKRDERKEIEEIKIEIQSSQLQTTIIFHRKLRLRRSTRSQKANDEIYRVNCLCHYRHFRGKQTSSLSSKSHLKFFSRSFLFFLRNCIGFHIIV